MRNSISAVVVLFALVATVFAGSDPVITGKRSGCLTRAEAHKLRDLWISFFVHIGDGGVQAGQSVTDDFHLYSESTNSVTYGFPPSKVQDPQYNSKQAFIAGQIAATANQPYGSFDVVSWDYGCDTFTFRWSLASSPTSIAGIDFVHVQVGSFLFERAYSEWNTKLLLSNIGCKFVGSYCGFADCSVCPAASAA